jgi:thiamine biosynthesis protein ThiS
MAAEAAITLNGGRRTISEGLSVTGLLAELGVDSRKVVVEFNREIVPYEKFESTILRDGDSLEILTLVSGG